MRVVLLFSAIFIAGLATPALAQLPGATNIQSGNTVCDGLGSCSTVQPQTGASEFEDQAKSDEAEEEKKKNCPVPKKRPLRNTDRYFQAAYIAEAKQQLGNQTGQDCYEIYMAEGTDANVAPLQDTSNQENVCVNGTCYDEDGNSWPDPNAAPTETSTTCTGTECVDEDGNSFTNPNPPNNEISCTGGRCVDEDGNDWTESVNTANNTDGSSSHIEDAAYDPSQQPSVYANEELDKLYEDAEPISDNPDAFSAEQTADAAALNDTRPVVPQPTPAELERMTRMVYAECGGKTSCMRGVAETIRNRVIRGLETGKGPKTYDEALKWTLKLDENYNYIRDSRGRRVGNDGGYYQSDRGNINRFLSASPGTAKYNGALDAVNRSLGREGYTPANITNGALHNWGPRSGTAAGAITEMAKYQIRSAGGTIIGGEYFYRKPGESVNIANYQGGVGSTAVASNPSNIGNVANNQVRQVVNATVNNIPKTNVPVIDNAVRTFAGVMTGNRNTNLSSPLGGVTNAGSMLGSLVNQFLGGSQQQSGSQSPLGSLTSAAPGLSGAFGNLSNLLNPFSRQQSSVLSPTRTTSQAQQSNQQLLNLYDRQLSEYDQMIYQNGNNAQTKTMLQQHLSQIDQFKQQNPQADHSSIDQWRNSLRREIQQINQFEQEQHQQAVTNPEGYKLQQKRLFNQQLAQREAAVPGRTKSPARSTSAPSDLAAVALKAEKTLNNEYRFRGSLSRTLVNKDDHLSVGEIGSYFGSGVTHELLLDYACDGSVDAGKVFTTPYYSILPKADGADVLLSEYLEVPEAGLHCFAFEVDTENKIPETDERNNVSAWREFIAGFGADTATSTALPSLNFEVSAYTENYASQVHDWTSEDITIAPGQELAFRWDAPAYEQCVPLLSSLTPDVASNVTPVDRNTLSENIDLHEHTGYYELRCVSGDAVKVETVYVRVTE